MSGKVLKFHINPHGDAMKCEATVCPYGADAIHGANEVEARRLYEASQDANLFSNSVKVDKGVDDELVHNGVHEYSFPASAVPRANEIIDKANRRLARQGIDERFEVEFESYFREQNDESGAPRAIEYVNMTLNTPAISYKGYEFLAVVDRADDGVNLTNKDAAARLMTRTRPGVELNGWRPESQACEHCGQTRHRSKTYLVQGPNGERNQIGSTCVESYLGIKPAGLWSLDYNIVEKLDEDEEFLRSYSSERYVRPVDYTLAMALAVSDDGKNFVSKGFAYDTGMDSTDSLVYEALEGNKKDTAEWRAEMVAKAQEYMENGRVQEILENIQKMEGDSDYVTNLKIVAEGDWVSHKYSGILVSALAAERKKEREAKTKIEWTPGFIAPVKESVKGMKMTVVSNVVSEENDPYSYDGRTVFKSRVTLQDENGHQAIWWASRKIHVEEGVEVELKGGSVKAHSKYNDVDQTVLTRVKVEETLPDQ